MCGSPAALRSGSSRRRGLDSRDKISLTDFSTNTLQGFDPETERFQAYRIPTTDALVRQIVEVGGVIWGAESATERLIAFSAAS
jgi:virginiamycin B lyase